LQPVPGDSGAAPRFDIAANRAGEKYGTREQLGRLLWWLAEPMFRCSPRPFFAWRRFLLRRFGAQLGRDVHVYPSARIVMPWHVSIGEWSAVGEDALIYALGTVSIGSRVTISQRAHLCAGTHDYTDPAMPLLKPPITIGDDVWICADAFVGPGVRVGDGAVVAARAVVVKDVEPWTVVAGNPARPVKARTLRSRLP